jgi:hypothetical protein
MRALVKVRDLGWYLWSAYVAFCWSVAIPVGCLGIIVTIAATLTPGRSLVSFAVVAVTGIASVAALALGISECEALGRDGAS